MSSSSAEEKLPLHSSNFNPYRSTSNDNLGEMRVERPIYCQDDVHRASSYHQPRYNFGDGLKDIRHNCSIKKTIYSLVPLLYWLPKYPFKEYLCNDIVAGLTVAIIHIPQGLAYAFLANIPPIIGLYMALFPVLMYVIFGTSRHISMGTFAVTCLMVGKSVIHYSDPRYFAENANIPPNIAVSPMGYSPTQVAIAVTAVCGIYQILMFLFRMGRLSNFLSATLVSGFTTGASIHVASTQLPQIFGLSLKRHVGLFKIIKILKEFVSEISNTNRVALIISVVCIILLILNQKYVRPAIAKRTRLDFPVELILMLITTAISYKFNLKQDYDIKLVDNIPIGIPSMEIPKLDLMQLVMVDAITVTLVSYVITVSMALIYANKHGYDIDGNQELLAMGAGNILGSLFQCCPVTASLSRSSIQESVGGKTQMASIVSCIGIVCILLWIGPIFESLPRCVLASIIIVALKSMLWQVTTFGQYWRLNKVDGVIWMTTFVTVVLIDIDIGLGVGICLSVIVLLVKGMTPYACVMGVLPNTELYLDTSRHNKAREIDRIKIFHYSGGLSFAQCDNFKRTLIEEVGVNVNKVIMNRKRELSRRQSAARLDDANANNNRSESDTTIAIEESNSERLMKQTHAQTQNDNVIVYFDKGTNVKFQVLVLDFAAVVYIDPAGIKLLETIIADYRSIDVIILLASVPDPIYECLKNFELKKQQENGFVTFPTIHDAVLYATRNVLNVKNIDLL